MCERFTLAMDAIALQQSFPDFDIPDAELTPRFNIAPTQPVAVIPNDGSRALDFFVWGLIPSWARDATFGNRMINARAETLSQKPSFKAAYKRRRCLILSDGFYEWSKLPNSTRKTPYFICMASGDPFAFAGLWETWFAPDGSEIKSCVIITTRPNELVARLHNRMPAILPREAYNSWLNPEECRPTDLPDLLTPFPANDMSCYPVSTLINNPKVDTPECRTPL
ncbi:MAG: SOS response-associated peptidase [Chloroflexota bacterium]